ncbi:MAG: nuclear transport factor 2 family protein [Pseudomonadota bacterium]
MDTPESTIEAYRDAWNAMDFSALLQLWDHSEAEIYYLAEEFEKPMVSLDEVSNYFDLTTAAVESVQLWVDGLHLKSLAEDLQVATFDMHVDASLTGSAARGVKPLGIDVRVSSILRQREGQWRFIHYVEAPLGALPFVRRAYQANTRG